MLSVPLLFVVINVKQTTQSCPFLQLLECLHRTGGQLGMHRVKSFPPKSPYFPQGSKGAVKGAISNESRR